MNCTVRLGLTYNPTEYIGIDKCNMQISYCVILARPLILLADILPVEVKLFFVNNFSLTKISEINTYNIIIVVH